MRFIRYNFILYLLVVLSLCFLLLLAWSIINKNFEAIIILCSIFIPFLVIGTIFTFSLTIEFSGDGIKTKIFKKVSTQIRWDEINDIKHYNGIVSVYIKDITLTFSNSMLTYKNLLLGLPLNNKINQLTKKRLIFIINHLPQGELKEKLQKQFI